MMETSLCLALDDIVSQSLGLLFRLVSIGQGGPLFHENQSSQPVVFLPQIYKPTVVAKYLVWV
jgi:hypothetical protein